MQNIENDARVLFARKGYYKGKEVTVTHRNPETGEVWLEDYQISKSPVVYGCWVNADSVNYQGEKKDESNKRRTGKANQKTRNKQRTGQGRREKR